MKKSISAFALAASLAAGATSLSGAAVAGPFANMSALKDATPPVVETVRWGGWGWGLGGGLLAGALIGSALAAPYYGYGYGYGYPYAGYSYGYGYPYGYGGYSYPAYGYGYAYPRYRYRYWRRW